MEIKKEQLFETLVPKDRNLNSIAKDALKKPEIISFLLEGVQNENARIRYGCLNTLVKISEKNPEKLYPHFNLFTAFLSADNNIIKLAGIKIIANLSRVDYENKFDKIFDNYYSFITDPIMTTAANVSKGSAIIAKAKPYLSKEIADQLLKVTQTKYKTEECKNILIGHVINSFDKILMQLKNKESVLDFVKMNTDNAWPATKIKAEKFLKKYSYTNTYT